MKVNGGGGGGEEDLDELARAVQAADQPLDEVARVRMQTRILAAPEPLQGTGAPRLRWLALTLALGAGAAVAVLLMMRAGRSPVSPVPGWSAEATRSFTHLEVPAGSTIHTVLAGRAYITLIGPGEVDLISVSAPLLAIRMPKGVLIGDFDHSGGGVLRIDSPDASTEVVGTRFAIEASPIGSRVSVARGSVSVRDARQQLQIVRAGQSWSSAQRVVAGIGSEVLNLFETSQRSLVKPTAPNGVATSDPSAIVRTAVAASTPAATGDSTEGASSGASSARATASMTVQRVAPRTLPTIAPSVAPPVDPAPLRPPPSTPVAPAETSPPATSIATAPVAAPSLVPGHRVPAAATAPETRPEESPEVLYAWAESAMRNGDLPAAQAALERVVRTGAPAAAASARYELARLAMRAGDSNRAARLLDEMLAGDRASALREPARFLRCRIAIERGGAGEATACLRQFLQDYPRSVHAAAARQSLGQASP